jgi:hypothetical protein
MTAVDAVLANVERLTDALRELDLPDNCNVSMFVQGVNGDAIGLFPMAGPTLDADVDRILGQLTDVYPSPMFRPDSVWAEQHYGTLAGTVPVRVHVPGPSGVAA